jgi:predicted Zn finger-like uncharacterized protein
MLLTCPACSTKFEINAALLGPAGRKVKCGKCAHRWHVMLEGTTDSILPASVSSVADSSPVVNAASPPASLPDSTPPLSPAELRELRREAVPKKPWPPWEAKTKKSSPQSSPFWTKRRVMIAAAIYLVLALLVAFRHQIIVRVPALAGMYQAIGMSVQQAGTGLTVQNLQIAQKKDGDDAVLVVTGQIANGPDQTRRIKGLQAYAVNAEGGVLKSWPMKADPDLLRAGEIATFQITVKNDIKGMNRIEIGFAKD